MVDVPCVVNVQIADDESICTYNHDYRNINKPTDVLSFPMQVFDRAGWKDHGFLELDKDTGDLPLGDIIISAGSVHRQAKEHGITTEQETAYLIIHSTLHLLGYNHDSLGKKKTMRGREKLILNEMGYVHDKQNGNDNDNRQGKRRKIHTDKQANRRQGRNRITKTADDPK